MVAVKSAVTMMRNVGLVPVSVSVTGIVVAAAAVLGLAFAAHVRLPAVLA